MRHAIPFALLFAHTTAFAGGGGGGFTIGGGYYPSLRDGPAPGTLGCLGGTGFGFSDSGLRVGGEGTFCRGRYSSMLYGGAQVGFHRAGEFMSWSVHSGAGVGTLGDDGASTGPYRSIFVYLKPTVSVGFGWGASGMELAFYAMTPFNLVQWVSDGESRGVVNVQPGVQVSFLFGRLVKRRPVTAWPEPAPPGSYAPPPQPPPQEDLPLAIPADEVDGYPPPPPPR